MAAERTELSESWREALQDWVKHVLLGRARDSLTNRRYMARRQLQGSLTYKRQGREGGALLLDISAHGLRLRLAEPVEIDEIIKVSATEGSGWVGRQRLSCRVRWCQRVQSLYEAGLEYCDTPDNLAQSWVQMALSGCANEQDKRRFRRVPAEFAVQISDSDSQHRQQGLCLNLGGGGCLLEVRCRFRLHQLLKVDLGPHAQQPLVSLTGRVVGESPSLQHGSFRYHVEFFQGHENPHYTRLQSLVLALMEERHLLGWSESEGPLPE